MMKEVYFISYNKRILDKYLGQDINFVPDNTSFSSINVLRGLHYQLPPNAQSKLVRVYRVKYMMLR